MAITCRRCSKKFELSQSDAENTKQRKFCSRSCELAFEEEKKDRYSKNQNAKKEEKKKITKYQISVPLPKEIFNLIEKDRKRKGISRAKQTRNILEDHYSDKS